VCVVEVQGASPLLHEQTQQHTHGESTREQARIGCPAGIA
jgi:hypothetical protein